MPPNRYVLFANGSVFINVFYFYYKQFVFIISKSINISIMVDVLVILVYDECFYV